MELNDKLFENEDTSNININRVVFDNKNLEIKTNDAKIT